MGMMTGMPILHAIRHYYGAIVLVGAIVLNPEGIAIKAPAQLGDLLRPFLGKAAPVVMGIAIIGAGFPFSKCVSCNVCDRSPNYFCK